MSEHLQNKFTPSEIKEQETTGRKRLKTYFLDFKTPSFIFEDNQKHHLKKCMVGISVFIILDTDLYLIYIFIYQFLNNPTG